MTEESSSAKVAPTANVECQDTSPPNPRIMNTSTSLRDENKTSTSSEFAMALEKELLMRVNKEVGSSLEEHSAGSFQ